MGKKENKEKKTNKYIPPEKSRKSKVEEVLKEEKEKDNGKVLTKYKAKVANNEGDESNKKKLKKKIIILGVVFLFLVFVVWRVFSFFSKYQYQEIDRSDIGINEEMFKSELNSIINIALLGVDKNNISDAILVVSINPTKEPPTIKMISIARDTLVEVYPKNKRTYYTKINEAYGNGGEVTTLRTLNKNFNLNVRNFISIEMAGFATIVDKLGGIDLEITKEERDQINGIINTTKELKSISKEMVPAAGKVHLNGPQAVAFARARKVPTKDGVNDDFGRGDRQKEVLTKIFEKVLSTPKSKIFSLIEPCLKYLKTSFKLTEIIKICRDFMGRKYVLEQISVPNQNAPLNRDYKIIRAGQETSTVFYDLRYAGKLINEYIYKDVKPDQFLKDNPPPSLSYSRLNVSTPRYSNKDSGHYNNKGKYSGDGYNKDKKDYWKKDRKLLFLDDADKENNLKKSKENKQNFDDFVETFNKNVGIKKKEEKKEVKKNEEKKEDKKIDKKIDKKEDKKNKPEEKKIKNNGNNNNSNRNNNNNNNNNKKAAVTGNSNGLEKKEVKKNGNVAGNRKKQN